MNNLFLVTLNKVINHYLNLDPESKKKLTKLDGKIIGVELLPFHFKFTCLLTPKGMTLASDDSYLNHANAYIRGTPIQMLNMLISKERNQFFADDLSIEGDAECAQQIVSLFDDIQVDYEEHLSHWIGDIPAQQGGQLFRKLIGWRQHIHHTLTKNIDEYIHEEANYFPSREALQDFFADIDTLRMDVDRLEATIKHLHSLFNEKSQ